MNPSFVVLIPARYAATRLPGKPLRDLVGKPLIQHVYERACESGAQRIVIATDDERIRHACEGFGAEVCMTSPDHLSGTDRLAEAARILRLSDDEIVVNLQGDEPLMPAMLLQQVAENLDRRHDAEMTTLCVPILHEAELFNPAAVKVVTDRGGFALYFSRAPIPWHRDAFAVRPGRRPDDTSYYRHLGIYGHRAAFLQRFVHWSPAPLERTESLEQLRVLWNGMRIHVDIAHEVPPPGVDTLEDLEKAAAVLRQRQR